MVLQFEEGLGTWSAELPGTIVASPEAALHRRRRRREHRIPRGGAGFLAAGRRGGAGFVAAAPREMQVHIGGNTQV